MSESASEQEQPFLIRNAASLNHYLNTCPTAKTLVAYSPLLKTHVLHPLPCKRWTCPWCAHQNIRRTQRLIGEAKPNRLMTLTVDPKFYSAPREAYDQTRRQIAPLISILRRTYGTVEYYRVVEVTKKGWPHYHMLVRSGYLPHNDVASQWNRLTGAKIVDVRQVRQTWDAARYITKYLSKLHDIPWTSRHISYSRKFFPPRDPDWQPNNDYLHFYMLDSHPIYVLLEYAKNTETISLPNNWQTIERP